MELFSLACLVLFLLTLPVSSRVENIPAHTYKSYSDLCSSAKYPTFCHAFTARNHSRGALAIEAMALSKSGIQQLLHSCRNFTDERELRLHAALRDCSNLLQDALGLINGCLSDARYYFTPVSVSKLEDMQTWMSGALTDYHTCMDGLREAGEPGKAAAQAMSKQGAEVDEMISTALSFIVSMYPPGSRRGSSTRWIDITRRRLASSTRVTPNVTVAKDGSGQFTSITAALASAPTKSKSRFVIYVKAGVYTESVEVSKSQTNIMIIGDGMRKTVITGKKSVQDPGVTTFTSATVIISGNNFLAQGVTFQNTAGAVNHQAVALRVSADQVAFYKCSFEGYQDTLYAHSQRQFYSECRIYGTVDFIFGNAAAVFLNSELVARVPMSRQKNTLTAQGRTDPNQNTGFSFQSCSVDGNADLKSVIQSFPTYLGRPWKEYSLTVFLKCYEGDVIHPAGWLEWDGDFALKTLFYGEYLATGPGSGTSQRVSWSTQITNETFANQFSARNFLSGQDWLPATTFPFLLDV